MNHKKIFLSLILFSCMFSRAHAADLYPNGYYLEYHQWGALEKILTDQKAGRLTTDECVIYGCYVLAQKEPARPDGAEKARLLPPQYKTAERSAEAGPYFFVSFIYKNESALGTKAIEIFNASDWSDNEYIAELTANEKFMKIINETPFETDDKGKQIKHICAAIFRAYNEKVIKPETLKYKKMMGRIGIQRYYQKLTPFFEKCQSGCITTCSYNYYDLVEKENPDIFCNRKMCNVLNYYYYETSHPVKK